MGTGTFPGIERTVFHPPGGSSRGSRGAAGGVGGEVAAVGGFRGERVIADTSSSERARMLKGRRRCADAFTAAVCVKVKTARRDGDGQRHQEGKAAGETLTGLLGPAD